MLIAAPMDRDPESEKITRPRPRRAILKSTLAFGLVSIPVSLHRAVVPKSAPHHEIHDEDGGRVRRVAVCARDGRPVPRDHILHGYDLGDGRRVNVRPREIAALASSSRRIEIDTFVDPAEIDPSLHVGAYYLVPEEGGERAYLLLSEAMRSRRLYAVARAVLRGRERLAVVRPAGPLSRPSRALSLSILIHADELVPPAEIEALIGADGEMGQRERGLAERLVDLHTGALRLDRYHDEQRERVMAYLEQKLRGESAPPAPPAPLRPELDLVGALEASLREAEKAA